MLYNVRTSKHKSQADQLSSSQYFYLNLKGKVSYNSTAIYNQDN